MSLFPSQPECNLAGAGVLVTRATNQAVSLCRLIAAKDGRPMRFPAVEICEPEDPDQARSVLSGISGFDIVIFVSPNAVLWGIKQMPDGTIPPGIELGAVGKRTAQTLAESGYPVDIVPEQQFDSEGLLQTHELRRPEGKRILIVRGNGGRELLAEELQARGAEVEYAEVYCRNCPNIQPTNLIYRWSDDVDVVTVTSAHLLDNLFTLMGEQGRHLLLETPMIVISDRMRQQARELGCQQVFLARGADEDQLMAALCVWSRSRG